MSNQDTELDRRTFLKSAVGSVGFAGVTLQDEPSRPRYTRRIALDYPERLEGGPRRKILLMTDRTNENPDVSEVEGCRFSNWPPEQLTIWEGIVVDWENAAGDFGPGSQSGSPTVRANRLVEIDRIFVDEQDTPVPLGTPYIVNGVQECPGEFRGLTVTKLPGINVETEPGVSTDEGTQS